MNPKGSQDVVDDSLTLSEGLTWTITQRGEPRAYYVRAALGGEGQSDSQVAAGSPESFRKLLLAHKLAPDAVSGGFSLIETTAMEPSPEQRKEGELGVVRTYVTSKEQGIGYIAFVIYGDRAMAERHGVGGLLTDSWLTLDIALPTRIGEVKAKGQIPIRDTTEKRVFMYCARLDPQLPVIVLSFLERPLREGEDVKRSSDFAQELIEGLSPLLITGIEHLAAVLKKGDTTSSLDKKTVKEE